jgi:Tol biopolymer transport system component
VVASVLGGLLPAVSPAVDAAHAAPRSVAAVDLVSGGIDDADPGDAVGEVVPDADASQVAYTTGRRGTPGTDAWVRNLASGSATRAVPGWDGRAPLGRRNAATGISADGRHVAVTSDATNLTGPAVRRVSVPSGDIGGGVGENYEGQAVSADGRYVVFASASPQLVPGDTNGTRDVFRHDRVLGTTTRVPVRPDGSQSTGDAQFPDISADGRYVSFVSTGTDLVPGEVSGDANVFVRDMTGGRTIKISVSIDGGPIYSDIRWAPSISADGRRVAFTSWASNLVPGDENQRADVFVRDWTAGTTTLASISGTGARANEDSYAVALSGDGRRVAFESTATNLAPGDDDGAKGVFLRDLDRGTTAHASAARAEGHDWPSYLDGISGDGRHVVFHSADDDLVAGDTNDGWDLFRYDAQTRVSDRVSVDDGGRQRPYSDGAAGDVSDDGRYVLFTHAASPADSIHGVFLHDTRERRTTRVDVAPGVTPNAVLHLPNPRISGNGSVGVFRSRSSNLVADDAGAASDVFAVALPTLLRGYVRDRDPDADGRLDEPGETTTVPVGGPAVPVGDVGLSADASQVVFVSPSAGLVTGDTNGCPDVFVHDRDTDGNGVLDETGRARVVRVSVSDAGVQGTGVDCGRGAVAVSGARMSPSGRYVTFTTRFRGLADGSEGAVLRRDRDVDGDGRFDEAGEVLTTRLAEATGGAGPWPPAPVADTGDVALLTADAMAAGDTDDTTDLYVAGAGPPQRRRVPGARPVTALSISADGATVAYRAADGHVHAATGAELPVDVDGSARTSSAPALSADGGAVAFLTPDALVASDRDAAPDAYLSTLTGPPVPALTAALTSRQGTREVTSTPPGASTVKIGQLPAERLPDMGDFGVVVDPEAASRVVGNSPIRNSPIQNSPIQNSPIQNSPIRNSPIRNSPIRNSPIGDLGPLIAGSPSVRNLPVTQIGLRPPQTWRVLLEGSPAFAERLPSTVTLGEVLDEAQRRDGHKDLRGLKLDDLDWSASPLAALSPTALLLGPTALSRLVLADGARLVPWCDRFREITGRTCQAAGIGNDATLGRADAELGAVLSRHSVLRRIPLRPNLGALAAAGAPVLGIDLPALKLDVTRIGDVPVAAAVAVSPKLATRQAPGGTTFAHALATRRLSPAATLQHVATAVAGVRVGDVTGAFPDTVGVGDVILGYLDRDDYPFERLDLLRSGVQAYDCAAVGVRHELSFAIGGYRRVDATVTMGFPRGTLVRGLAGDDGCPSAAGAAADARARAVQLDDGGVPPEPAVAVGPSGPTVTWRLADLPAGRHRLSVLVNPPAFLGDGSVTASVTAGGRTAVARPRLARVVESADPSPEAPAVIDAKTLQLGYIADPSDVDGFEFQPGKRTAVGVRLSHFEDGDADLVLYGTPPPTSRTGVSEARHWGTPPAPASEARGDVPGTSSPVADEATTADVPTEAGGRDVLAASTARGDGIAEAAAAAGADLVQVSAYNGASSEKPYLLRLREQPIEEPASCAPRTTGGGPALDGNGYSVRAYGDAPETPPRPGGRKTLILVDQSRFRATHGAAGAATVASALEQLARETEGVVMPLDANGAYREARARWDADPCSVDAANGVVSAAATVVRDFWRANRMLQDVVIVGGDQQLPMARLPDVTRTGNESHYDHPALGDPLGRAADRSYLLSDDPYVDFDPVRWLGRRLYLPNLGLGRLVDTPDEIAAQVQTYLKADGTISTISPSPAGVTAAGYGFMSDGAAETAAGAATSVNRSRGAPGRAPVDALPVSGGRRWTAADLTAQLRRKAQPVSAMFAHAEHDRALSEAGYFGANDMIRPAQVADALAPGGLPPTSRLLLTMGCHTGMSVPASAHKGEDFARTVAGSGRAAMVAVTGYSSGDSTAVGLHERLLALYADQIGYRQSIGQALAAAKRAYFRDQGRYGDNDEKALTTTVLYGLPMYRLGAPKDAPPQERVTPELPPGSSTPVLDLSLRPSFVEHVTDRGTYWTSEDGALTVADRPLQPRVSREVTAEVPGPGGDQRLRAAHGVLVTRLADAETHDVDAVFARPVTGPAGGGAERVSTGTVFPELPARLTTYDDPGGPAGPDPDRIGIRQHLVVTPGQFTGDSSPEAAGRGTQVLYRDVGVRVLYASQAAADDWTVPTVGAPTGRRELSPSGAPQATFSVAAADDSGIQRVLVLYRRDREASFEALDLRLSSGTAARGVWSGTAALPAGTEAFEYLVQVADGAGNVAALSGKGAGIPDRPAPAVLPAARTEDQLQVSEGTSGTTPLEVPVYLDRPAPADLTIPVSLLPGTAAPGDDYRVTSPAVTVPRGELMGTFAVQIVADGVAEPTEDFRVRFGDAPGVRLATRETRVVVLDDDSGAAEAAYGRVKYSPTEPDPVVESENSAGSVNTVRRLAAGRYDVYFRDVQGPWAQGDFHNDGAPYVITHESGTPGVHCQANSHGAPYADPEGRLAQRVGVRCFDAAGRDADGRFTVTYLRGGTASGGAGGFVYAEQKGNARSMPPVMHQFNSAFDPQERSTVVERTGPGEYVVTMPRLGDAGLRIRVMGMGEEPRRCTSPPEGSATSTGALQVQVTCRDLQDTPTDTVFTLHAER